MIERILTAPETMIAYLLIAVVVAWMWSEKQ